MAEGRPVGGSPADGATRRWGRLALECLLIAAIYVGLSALVLAFGPRRDLLATFWPAAGFALAVIAWRGPSRWPGVLLGAGLASVVWVADAPGPPAPGSLPYALLASAFRTGATVLCARLLAAGEGRLSWLHSTRGVVRFLLLGGLLYPVLTATTALVSLAVTGFPAAASRIWSDFPVFFVANSAGTLLVAPPLLAVVSPAAERQRRGALEAVACAAAVLAASLIVFREPRSIVVAHPPLFLLAPPLIWAALRFGLAGASFGLLGMALVAVGTSALAGAPDVVVARVTMRLQLYLEVLVATILTLAAVVEERHRTALALEAQRNELDATVRLRTRELRAERDFGELVVETAHAYFAVLDRRGRFVQTNSAFQETSGFRGEELRGRSYRELLDPADVPRVDASFGNIIEGFEGESFDAGAFTRTGQRREIHWSSTALPGPDGTVEKVLATGIDVTERNRDRRELESTLAVLQATLDAITDGVLVLDLEGRTVIFNRRLLELWGLPPEVLAQGQEASFRFVRDRMVDPERFLATLREIESDPASESADVVELTDGRILERISVPQRIGDRIVGRVWSFRDATPRLRAEEARNRLILEERRARLAAERAVAEAREAIRVRNEFFSIASHELKTPLTSMKAQLQQLRRLLSRSAGRRVEAARVRSGLDLAVRQLARIHRLLDEVLGVSGHAAIELAPVRADLRQIVLAEVERWAEAAARARVELRVEEGPSIPGEWDPARLSQLVRSLLANAIKFGAGRPVDVRVEAGESAARILVRDRGIGLHGQDRERIFERFERAVDSRHYGGLGLGLWIARRIAEASHGSISVQSEPGAGATFTVELPFAPLRPAEEEARP